MCCALPTGNVCTYEGIMCTQGDTAANGKEIGSIGDGHWVNWKGQIGPLEGFLGLFCQCYAFLARMKTAALLTDGIRLVVPCQRGMHAKARHVYVREHRSEWKRKGVRGGRAFGERGAQVALLGGDIRLFCPYCP